MCKRKRDRLWLEGRFQLTGTSRKGGSEPHQGFLIWVGLCSHV